MEIGTFTGCNTYDPGLLPFVLNTFCGSWPLLTSEVHAWYVHSAFPRTIISLRPLLLSHDIHDLGRHAHTRCAASVPCALYARARRAHVRSDQAGVVSEPISGCLCRPMPWVSCVRSAPIKKGDNSYVLRTCQITFARLNGRSWHAMACRISRATRIGQQSIVG